MARKRVHEIAKSQGLTSKEVLAALKAAGIEATAAASSVEEEEAIKAIAAAGGDGGGASKTATKAKPAAPKQASAKSAKTDGKPAEQPEAKAAPAQRPARRGDSAGPAKAGGKRRRRVVIDSQASRRDAMRQAPPPRPPRRRGGRRRRPLLKEPPRAPVEAPEPEAIKVPSGATVREVGELLGLGSSEVIKKLMTMGEMATLTQTLSDET